ncbi:hypothetical protein SeMB42_g01161 [Synchytrium endobioticum]|uniref:Amino acid permease/ SLC12A domain-containing protein n=1 Tax=Synchytrium endobioticum TaxID=286115 RepID=A0A507DNN7_9FUNG|nr:hypothetical protein SeLEV6574_g06984 [Synchytrium endobioticum]TPX52807.1 hypothetical protein SeMB42_g01161 [Synchytrium endobioticum]
MSTTHFHRYLECSECGHSQPLAKFNASLLTPTTNHLHEHHQVKISLSGQPSRFANDHWEFAGWGQTIRMSISSDIRHASSLIPPKHKLNEWQSTAIAANDLTSSVFFSVGLTIIAAGQYAPICMILAALSLIPLRYILAELGALPLNGAMYSTLISLSKIWAVGAAGVLAMDFTTTAVVSGASACQSLIYMTGGHPAISTSWLLPTILAIFSVVTAIGMRESSTTALIIFIFHILTMIAIIIGSIIYLSHHGVTTFMNNWQAPSPSGNILLDIFYGWSVAFLSSTGLETSGNYIEDQAPGVFPNTLRNMTYLSLVFPPLLTFLALCILPLSIISANPSITLTNMALVMAGPFGIIVSVDSILILSGGVLTAFVGMHGLAYHLTGDGLLPRVSRKQFCSMKGYPVVSMGFFAICCALFFIARGDITILSLVFAMSFLMVLLISALANIFLKYQRGRLPRPVDASYGTVFLGSSILVTAIIGTALQNASAVFVFGGLWLAIISAMWLVLRRVKIAKFILFILEKNDIFPSWTTKIIRWIQRTRSQPVAFFTNQDEIHVLNKAILYMASQELTTANLKIIHIYEDEAAIPSSLEFNVYILDHIYPKIKVDLVLVRAHFNPESVKWVSDQLGIPLNLCFITTPSENHPYPIGDFGGVRVIML